MTAHLLARCIRGLEWIAAAEIADRLPDASGIGLAAREVTFRMPSLTPRLVDLRTVDDLFIKLGTVGEVGSTKDVPPLLAKQLARLDWVGCLEQLRQLRPIPDRPQLDVVASLDGGRRYNRYAVENALGPLIASTTHGSYLARTAEGRQPGEPDVTVRVRVQGLEALAALRVSGRPLHRRAYKQDTGAGTLHPPVAAGLARMAEPAHAELVLDPFCGDGTIAIETALSYPEARVAGSDVDPARLANARRNQIRAEVPIELTKSDAGHLPVPEHSIGAVVTNPPWNVSVEARGLLSRSLDLFWRRLPTLMTGKGRVCLIADLELDAPSHLRRLSYAVAVASQIRLAGRASQVVLCAPPGCGQPELPSDLLVWRQRALSTGVITDEGY